MYYFYVFMEYSKLFQSIYTTTWADEVGRLAFPFLSFVFGADQLLSSRVLHGV